MRVRWVRAVVTGTLLLPVRLYQVTISPTLTKGVCRFYPSCSEYFTLAVHKHGPLLGSCKGVWRICRCNPFNRGGFDPP